MTDNHEPKAESILNEMNKQMAASFGERSDVFEQTIVITLDVLLHIVRSLLVSTNPKHRIIERDEYEEVQAWSKAVKFLEFLGFVQDKERFVLQNEQPVKLLQARGVLERYTKAMEKQISQQYEEWLKTMRLVDFAIEAVDEDRCTALHRAAKGGHESTILALLAVGIDPHASDLFGCTALHLAAEYGHSRFVARLLSLADDPSLVEALTPERWTALHVAANHGHDRVVAQLLAVSPGSVHAVACDGWVPLHCAVFGGHEAVAEALLAITPEAVARGDEHGNMLLHLAVPRCSEQFIGELWRRHPPSLHARNSDGHSPFDLLVRERGRGGVVEMWQHKVCAEDIAKAVATCHPSHDTRLRSVIHSLFETLAVSLNQDVVGTVLEYLGFPSSRRDTEPNDPNEPRLSELSLEDTDPSDPRLERSESSESDELTFHTTYGD